MVGIFKFKEYLRPTTIKEATSLLAKYKGKARLMAGGTDLLVEKPSGVEYLIDIDFIPLKYIKKDSEGIKIGALSTIRDIETSRLTNEGVCKILAKAACEIGQVNVKNLATVGGNLCSVPSADFPPVLLVLDAKVKIVGLSGERVVPLDDFFVDVKKTVLKSDELLVEVQVSNQPPNTGSAFLKISRISGDIALVNVATRITLGSNQICEDARIALGAVAPTPLRAKGTEELLKGKKMDNGLIQKAAQTASHEIKPISDVRASASYRKEMSKVLVKRALEISLKRAKTR
jgi:CO/xanthine dehydrogenase FAD-binding subunit